LWLNSIVRNLISKYNKRKLEHFIYEPRLIKLNYKEVNCTEPCPSVRFPCYGPVCLYPGKTKPTFYVSFILQQNGKKLLLLSDQQLVSKCSKTFFLHP